MRHDSPHYHLIAAALRGTDPGATGDWDWAETIKIASREEVLPALHGRLPAPAEIRDFFDGIHELNTTRNRQLLEQAESLAVLLNQVGIEPVLLKGASYLLSGVYADSGDRLIQDIDLLVSPEQSRLAFETIQKAGYEPVAPNPVAYLWHHQPALTQVHRIPVEVHHSLVQASNDAILPPREMIAASTQFHLGRSMVRIPAPEHLMTHLVMHSQIQHSPHDRIWPSLRTMYDLVLLERRFRIPWDRVGERFRKYGQGGLLDLHRMQVSQVMGAAMPAGLDSSGIRWWYRRTLWWEPRLRYVDPFYTCSRVVAPKIRFCRQLLKDPAGRKYVLSTPFRRSFYKRLLADILHG